KMAAISLSSYGIELYSLRGELAQKTVEIAVKENITVYDAAYIALAQELNTIFYTADEKLIKKMGEEYSKIMFHISKIL
ncbi:MAG: hypothetical protein DRJ38_07670, partial [Thermoprotei archaeon]